MNEIHLENPPEAEPSGRVLLDQAVAELTAAVGDLTVEQELRHTALNLAIRVYVCPRNSRYNDVVELADIFYKFLSSDGVND